MDEMMTSPMFLQEKLGFSPRVKVDQSKIILAGHSFGGASTILTSMNDKRVRACLVADPWFEPLVKQQLPRKAFSINKPIQMLVCGSFYDFARAWPNSGFDDERAADDFMSLSAKHSRAVQQIVLPDVGHINMCDASVSAPVELYMLGRHAVVNPGLDV